MVNFCQTFQPFRILSSFLIVWIRIHNTTVILLLVVVAILPGSCCWGRGSFLKQDLYESFIFLFLSFYLGLAVRAGPLLTRPMWFFCWSFLPGFCYWGEGSTCNKTFLIFLLVFLPESCYWGEGSTCNKTFVNLFCWSFLPGSCCRDGPTKAHRCASGRRFSCSTTRQRTHLTQRIRVEWRKICSRLRDGPEETKNR